jgi:hypothetical protein
LLFVCFALCSVAADGPLNLDDPGYLRRQYAWFLKQDPARQQQLRRLHAEFNQLPVEEQIHLVRTMQTYNAWLAKLPESDRQRVVTAGSPGERLDEIRMIREREWVETLPKPYREQYAGLDPDARHDKVQQWRAEEADRREEWALAQRHWADNPPGKVPAIFQADAKPLEEFVAHLSENLTAAERKTLDEARAEIPNGNYFAYPRQIVKLADQHPIFPWKEVGPKEWKELPDGVKIALQTQDPAHFRRPADLPKELRRAQGRWPEFAVELVNYCKKNGLTLPEPLGGARKNEMPAEVISAVTSIESQLRKGGEPKKADLQLLEGSRGKWPDYPRLVAELARKEKVALPGWTLPGPAQFWERHRIRVGTGKK